MEVSRLERGLSHLRHWLLYQRTRVQFPAPTWQLPAVCIISSRGSGVLFRLPWIRDMHVVQGHTCRQNPLTHKNKCFFFKSEFSHLSLSMWYISSSSCVIFMAVVMVLAINNCRDSPAGRQLESLLHTSTCSSPLYPLHAFFRTLKE